MSAPGHVMDYETTTIDVIGSDSQVVIDTAATERNCCDYCGTNAVCDSACNAVNIDTFLIGFTPLAVGEPRLLQQVQVSELSLSQFF